MRASCVIETNDDEQQTSNADKRAIFNITYRLQNSGGIKNGAPISSQKIDPGEEYFYFFSYDAPSKVVVEYELDRTLFGRV